MATYQISSQTTIPQLKDSLIGQTLFNQSYNSNISHTIDLTYGANNNNGLLKHDHTLHYYNNGSLTYNTLNYDHYAKIITITNTTSSFRDGHYDYVHNLFYPPLTTLSYPLLQNFSWITFAPNNPIIIYN
jgi:hypothetical protein